MLRSRLSPAAVLGFALALGGARTLLAQGLPKTVIAIAAIRDVPGDSLVTLRVSMNIAAGWHVGAQKPGGTGLPTELEWRLPVGWRLIEERWPKPNVERLGNLIYYTYSGILNVDVSFARNRKNARGPVDANLAYGMCSKDLCIPGRVTLKYPAR